MKKPDVSLDKWGWGRRHLIQLPFWLLEIQQALVHMLFS